MDGFTWLIDHGYDVVTVTGWLRRRGKDEVGVRVDTHRTWIAGPFGEREIAPYPMTLAPPKRVERRALIDC